MKLLIAAMMTVFSRQAFGLANGLAEAGHDVSVVCPDPEERSATGRGSDLHQPIRAEIVESVFNPPLKLGLFRHSSDCVKLALWALLDSPPILCSSGINQGSNLGTDILYSGTVSAAMEGGGH